MKSLLGLTDSPNFVRQNHIMICLLVGREELEEIQDPSTREPSETVSTGPRSSDLRKRLLGSSCAKVPGGKYNRAGEDAQFRAHSA